MKIVKFGCGGFGIRYGVFWHKYQDFKHPNFRWEKNDRFWSDCVTDEKTAREFFERLRKKDIVIKT